MFAIPSLPTAVSLGTRKMTYDAINNQIEGNFFWKGIIKTDLIPSRVH